MNFQCGDEVDSDAKWRWNTSPFPGCNANELWLLHLKTRLERATIEMHLNTIIWFIQLD